MHKVTIAIDGPAGAGKSTIAKIIASTLGITYLDTGAMYRAVALKAVNSGIDTLDKEKVASLANTINISIRFDNDKQLILLDNTDVSGSIRSPEISIGASNVAVIPEVRLRMVELQRAIANERSVVMDGRDIGTYVLPNADLKIYLTASVEERANRRFAELVGKGGCSVTLEAVKNDIEYRDKNDSSREFAPLQKAGDAVEIDTTGMSIEQVAVKIIEMIKGKV